MKNVETYLLLILTTILYGHHFWFISDSGLRETEIELLNRFQRFYPGEEAVLPKYQTRQDLISNYRQKSPYRNDKFLIPFLNWGPNNQLRGLQESLILAIKLNRTLCVPFFFKHFTVRAQSKLLKRMKNVSGLEFVEWRGAPGDSEIQNRCSKDS